MFLLTAGSSIRALRNKPIIVQELGRFGGFAPGRKHARIRSREDRERNSPQKTAYRTVRYVERKEAITYLAHKGRWGIWKNRERALVYCVVFIGWVFIGFFWQ